MRLAAIAIVPFCALVLHVAHPAAAQVQFSLVDAPPGSQNYFVLTTDFAGTAFGGYALLAGDTLAHRWSASGGYFQAGVPGAFDNKAWGISYNGQILVGTATYNGGLTDAFRWNIQGAVEVLPKPAGWDRARATAVSGNGAIAVGTLGPNQALRAVAWSGSGPMLFPIESGTSHASTISGNGLIVGGGHFAPGQQGGGFLWNLAASAVEYITEPGWGTTIDALSEDGSVASGRMTNLSTGQVLAFRWTQQFGVQPLVEVGSSGGLTHTSANGTAIVGNYAVDGSTRPFIWTTEWGFVDLIDMFEANQVDLSGLTSIRVQDISGDGRVIVGYAMPTGVPPLTQWRGWYAVIPSPSAAFLLACPVSLLLRRKRS